MLGTAAMALDSELLGSAPEASETSEDVGSGQPPQNKAQISMVKQGFQVYIPNLKVFFWLRFFWLKVKTTRKNVSFKKKQGGRRIQQSVKREIPIKGKCFKR